MTTRKRRWTRIGLGIALAVLAAWTLQIGRALFRWKAYIWVINYAVSSDYEFTDRRKHVIFVMADHYEPGRGEKGTEAAKRWMGKFRPIADEHRDSYNNRFKYTWFYPYDHRNEGVLAELSAMAYQGYGEVEMHWHVPSWANSRNFPGMLDEAVSWFQRYGALVSGGPERRTAFAYIAGNWALDGAIPGGNTVYNQIDVLFNKGCYADVTFSTIGQAAQGQLPLLCPGRSPGAEILR
jgi:hypothetical protein